MRHSLVRKLSYLGVILALLVLTIPVRGWINVIRSDPQYRLSQEVLATPGDVDTTSSIAILVLGGFRGFAANLLWSQALDIQEYKKDWNKLESVVQSIIKLQPHFIRVWTFQSWNLAWNVAAEWDAVEDKYYWIKQGAKFAEQGTQVNGHSPYLRWSTGWIFFQKIGKADEAQLLRKLYREDHRPEIDAQGREIPPFNPEELDNYQKAYYWFSEAVAKCDELGIRPKQMAEHHFRSYPSHALKDFALAQEEEGVFGERIQGYWLEVYESWSELGEREIIYREGKKIQLEIPHKIFLTLRKTKPVRAMIETIQQKLAQDPEQPGDGEPGSLEEDFALLLSETDELLKEFGPRAIGILPQEANEVFENLRAAYQQLREMNSASLVDPSSQGDAMRSAFQEFAGYAIRLERLVDEELYWSDRYASNVNFRYWKDRALAESEWDTIYAREHFYKGIARYEQGDPETAKGHFEKGLELWKNVLDQQRFRRVRDDDFTAEHTAGIVRRYLTVLQQLDEKPPEPVPFEDYLKRVPPPDR